MTVISSASFGAFPFAGIMSNIASDAGYVVVIPLGALVFAGAGRHPIAGLAAAFAGVTGKAVTTIAAARVEANTFLNVFMSFPLFPFLINLHQNSTCLPHTFKFSHLHF